MEMITITMPLWVAIISAICLVLLVSFLVMVTLIGILPTRKELQEKREMKKLQQQLLKEYLERGLPKESEKKRKKHFNFIECVRADCPYLMEFQGNYTCTQGESEQCPLVEKMKAKEQE